MGEQEDRLVSVHDVLGFLPDFDSLSDPLCCLIRFLGGGNNYQQLSFLFFSHPSSEGWPHHERTFSIYLCPQSF